MNRRDFINKSAQGLALLCSPSLLSTTSSLENSLFSEPKITHPVVKRNTQLLFQQLQYHNASYENMLQYLYEHLDHYPMMEMESEQIFTFYNRDNLSDLHPRQVTRAHIFLKSLQDPQTQKTIHAHLVNDFFDEKTEFGGIVIANKGAMVLEYLRDPSVDKLGDTTNDNLHYILPEGAVNTPHLGLYHCHAVQVNNHSRGILSNGDVNNTSDNSNERGEHHHLMFNLKDNGFDVIYYGGFPKEKGLELFHLRLGQTFG